jgi:hypothetical protein
MQTAAAEVHPYRVERARSDVSHIGFGPACCRGAWPRFAHQTLWKKSASGRLNVALPEIPMFTTPVFVLHAFGRQLPLRARLFIDFLVEALGVSRNLSL